MAEDKQKEARNRNLMRFVHAQDSGGIYDGTGTYAQALEEVKAGYKRGHWIWYVFPQMKGLGKSEISEFYGINGREEAKAYIEHPVLRERLVEICEVVLNSKTSVYDIFGSDTIKVRAYKNSNGSQVWGKYSKTKKVTVENNSNTDNSGFKKGDIVTFGAIDQNKDETEEPIEWIVLSNDDHKGTYDEPITVYMRVEK